MLTIEIGNITIIQRENKAARDSSLRGMGCYEIFVDDKSMMEVYCDDLDRVVLQALAWKHEGRNGRFADYAALMLGINAPLWG